MKLPRGTDEIEVPVLTAKILPPEGLETNPMLLIASESPDINHLLEVYLSGEPYEVLTATDGVDLLRKAQEHRPFSIIMGITLPNSPDTAGIPVIIISSVDDRELGLSLGAVEYMEKPVNREMLLGVLDRVQRRAG